MMQSLALLMGAGCALLAARAAWRADARPVALLFALLAALVVCEALGTSAGSLMLASVRGAL